VWWFAGGDGAGTGVFTTFGVVPAAGRAWYAAALVRPDRPLVFVADTEIARHDDRLSVRRPGLWADHVCEEPFEQWTVANEAHAVELDDPADALGRAHGTLTALAFDLEWYASGPAAPLTAPLGRDGVALAGYRQDGEIDGVVELPGGAITCVGPARRLHCWGDLSRLVLDDPDPSDQTPATTVPVAWPLPDDGLVVAQWLTPAGWRIAPRSGAS
jgi:hypothetical protein